MGVRGGMPVGADGRLHGVFTHNPSTLRLSMRAPNLQNIPRGKVSRVQAMVKQMFVAPEGSIFWARDYSGIEAVLVGYFAGSKPYTRCARLGVHAFFASHLMKKPADLGWDDPTLAAYFKEVKREAGPLYDICKRTVHMSNYRGSPQRMHLENPEIFRTTAEARTYQGLYFEIFPEIPRWHETLCRQVDKTTWVRNPFGYIHRFYKVLDWHKTQTQGWRWAYGEEAKRLIAFLPQSTASAILKRAGMTLYYDHPEVGETLRLFIHDELFGECLESELERCLTVSKQVMETPLEALPLDPRWEMGEYLSIRTEGKAGRVWGDMEEVL